MLRALTLVFLSWSSLVLADQRCFGSCLAKAEDVMLVPGDVPLENALRTAQGLAARECAEKNEQACALAARLDAALSEATALSKEKGAEAGRRLLAARQCIAALTRDEPLTDWESFVTAWCGTVLDGCAPKLMLGVGHARPTDRTTLVSLECAETLCPQEREPKPAACSAEPSSAVALALLRLSLARELPAAVAQALGDAFEKPRHPFFADVARPAPKAKPKSAK